jgi:hypothetical protein
MIVELLRDLWEPKQGTELGLSLNRARSFMLAAQVRELGRWRLFTKWTRQKSARQSIGYFRFCPRTYNSRPSRRSIELR